MGEQPIVLNFSAEKNASRLTNKDLGLIEVFTIYLRFD